MLAMKKLFIYICSTHKEFTPRGGLLKKNTILRTKKPWKN